MLKKIAAIVFISANLCLASNESDLEQQSWTAWAKETKPAKIIANIYNTPGGKIVLGVTLNAALSYLPTDKSPFQIDQVINNWISQETIKTAAVIGTEYLTTGTMTHEVVISSFLSNFIIKRNKIKEGRSKK